MSLQKGSSIISDDVEGCYRLEPAKGGCYPTKVLNRNARLSRAKKQFLLASTCNVWTIIETEREGGSEI